MNTRTRIAKWILFGLAVIINGYIVMHSCFNGAMSTNESSRVVNFLKTIINTFSPNAINASNIDTFSGVIRKIVGHFLLFVVDGFFSTWSIYFLIKENKWYKPYKGIIITLAFGLLVAGLTEIIQLNVPGRSGQLSDVGIDFSGYLIGTIILILILHLVIRHYQKSKASL